MEVVEGELGPVAVPAAPLSSVRQADQQQARPYYTPHNHRHRLMKGVRCEQSKLNLKILSRKNLRRLKVVFNSSCLPGQSRILFMTNYRLLTL